MRAFSVSLSSRYPTAADDSSALFGKESQRELARFRRPRTLDQVARATVHVGGVGETRVHAFVWLHAERGAHRRREGEVRCREAIAKEVAPPVGELLGHRLELGEGQVDRTLSALWRDLQSLPQHATGQGLNHAKGSPLHRADVAQQHRHAIGLIQTERVPDPTCGRRQPIVKTRLPLGGLGVVVEPVIEAIRRVAHDRVRQRGPLALSDITGISSVYYADLLGDRGVHEFNPTMSYMSPRWTAPASATTTFVDGGDLENTGVASLLAYDDIDSVIAMVSSPKAISRWRDDVIVERQVSALFGVRAYSRRHGYRGFDEPGDDEVDFEDCKVFATDRGEFNALTSAMGALHDAGEPVVVEQTLRVVRNDKFAIRGGRSVRVLWVYLSPSARWTRALHRRVRMRVKPKFPQVPTAVTQYSAADASLLSQFTGWMIEQNRDAVARLFDPVDDG